MINYACKADQSEIEIEAKEHTILRGKDLEAINGEQTTENTFFETGTKDYDIVFFIHGDPGLKPRTDQSKERDRLDRRVEHDREISV